MTTEAWQSMTLCEQLGNISSEVGRTIKRYRSGNDTDFKNALTTAVNMFDKTITNPNLQKHRRKEINRSKNQFLSIFYDNQNSEQNIKSIETYFMDFALATRKFK